MIQLREALVQVQYDVSRKSMLSLERGSVCFLLHRFVISQKIVAMIASSPTAIEICTLRLLRQLAEDQACQTSEALQRTDTPFESSREKPRVELGFAQI